MFFGCTKFFLDKYITFLKISVLGKINTFCACFKVNINIILDPFITWPRLVYEI